jgi:hypothetical protein
MTHNSPEADWVQATMINCDICKVSKVLIYPSSHFISTERGNAKGFVCSDCANTEEMRKIPIALVRPIFDGKPLDVPMTGSFHPVNASQDDSTSSSYQYWMEIGHMIIEEMAVWKDKILKFTFGGNRYKGLWLKPEWDGSRIVGISIAGDTPSKKLELDIYQRYRLTQFGFVEVGKSNKTWSIELSELEGSIPNASAVIIHILRFGYLLEPSDLNSITPTLDVDFSDPEYKRT